ncbi:hypothetical protein ERO13_D09G081500v2 [Gossypium hirsutum]|uniref:Uncharacterized protein LOC107891710 isoform X1 n=4 Tax=Gossypium TaxID=3633 RepID=A0A1U8I8G1_GOSHI|nr:uncharacterized protein LOC107891710 isoform X1 [Gossypium hirsutum]XP_016672064.1 uncharacterized protein LOC107891710 isoform X1 [Gossypium hirsutum]XP_040956401.1 uncharacterized protein LOC107891710 isoform X1 [Gossypium hirsutum]XP_040956402.1 uncharacterized protein LOC107891710 isoform X1 [Gossypium hirsutum]KAG4129441.1 hypothetical protein ERO13_D09G081500v2 [Gossypium hirsutum]
MGGAKAKSGAMDKEKKKKGTLIWRPVCTQDSSLKEPVIKDATIGLESDCQMQKSNDKVIEVTNAIVNSKALEDDIEDEAMKEKPELSAIKHSLSIQVGASVIRFVKGKAGSTKEKIEKETGVQIILPSSKQNDSIIIEGTSADSVAKASEEIQRVIDEAVKTASFDYSHFVSLPLAIHPELVSKLVGFQNSILGSSDACIDENPDGNSDGDNSEDSAQEQQLGNISVELEVADDEESVKVDVSVRPLDSNAPKEKEEPKSSNKSDLKIGKSVFIKPQTFHLTVLMLKLWNQKRVDLAAQVLKSTSSRVLDALDNRPVFVRLKGLDLMRGSLAKAQVVYAPAEEIDSENRLLHACKIMIDAFVEAGLVIDKDAKSELKESGTSQRNEELEQYSLFVLSGSLYVNDAYSWNKEWPIFMSPRSHLHATLMNARHRKRGKKGRFSSFNARAIFEHFGSEEWGEYLIRQAHLSQRFKYDENGYYHCCASIPFPENISS